MLAQSLQPILESLGSSAKNLIGKVEEASALLSPSTWEVLEQAHPGPYLFFAFDARMDPLMSQYIASGALAADTGTDLFAIFYLHTDATLPVSVSRAVLGADVQINENEHPALEYARKTLGGKALNFPGIVAAFSLTRDSYPVYISLRGHASGESLRSACQEIYEVLRTVRDSKRPHDSLARSLALRGAEYCHGQKTSVVEWLASFLGKARRNGGTLATVVTGFG